MARVRPLPRVACALFAATLLTLTLAGAGPAGAEEQVTLDVLRIVDGEYVVETVTVPAPTAEADADRLEAAPDVVAASPSVTFEITGTPDPHWDADGPGAASDVRTVWDTTQGEGQTVAVLDTGVDGTHPDLDGAVVDGTDTVGGAGSAWHGTGVAGVIAARADNGIGGAGMAPAARIMPVRVCNDSGCPSSSVARGVLWAADHGADVINLSLAGAGFSDVTAAAIRYALDKNISVVASTGNDGDNGNPVMYPAANNGVIAVSATSPTGTPAGWAVHGWQADIATVGEDVLLTMPGGTYGHGDGTSFSGPAVAGAVALLRAGRPGIAVEAVQSALQASADSGNGWDRAWGAGRLDVPAAFDAADRADAGIVLTPGAQSLAVSWASVPGATDYTVRVDGVVHAVLGGTSTTISGLVDGSQVAVDIQPDNGSRSRAALTTVGPAAPGTPVLHSATLGGTSSNAHVTLSISVPGGAGRFSLIRDGVGLGTVTHPLTGSPTSVGVLIGAMPTRATRWQVRIVGEYGRISPVSNAVTTGSGLPAAPPAVTGLAAEIDDDEVLLTWDDLGSAYTYQVSSNGSLLAGPQTAGASVAGPAMGDTRNYEVVAVDGWGQTGPVVDIDVARVPPPEMTTPPSVVGSPVVGQTVSTPDAFTGADTVTRTWRACGAGGCTTVAGDATHLITASEVGRTLEVSVVARNAGGATSAVSAPSATVTAAVPGAPTIGAAVAGDGSATVHWSAPLTDGGSSVTGYTVQAFEGGTPAGTTPAAADAGSVEVAGLADGTTYTFTVTATNAIGTGPASAASPEVTPHADLAAQPLDIALTHRLTNGGMALWRMPITDSEPAFGAPVAVRPLSDRGFSYDRSWSLAGAVGDITGSDDGTPDSVIWHASATGGALVWAVGGGADRTPRLWFDLRTGGWSWARSAPLLGDVTGDGWEDLVVRHSTAAGDSIVWVFPSDGERLGPPERWGRAPGLDRRAVLADLDGDGREDLLTARPASSAGTGLAYDVQTVNDQGTAFDDAGTGVFTGFPSAGWSFASSRQLAGDVTGDGRADLVTVHSGANGGLLVWVHRNCATAGDPVCFEPPTRWQDLRTAGWSYAGSRQLLADTDGDGVEDLVTLHSSGATPGLLVWRHVSDGARLLAPDRVADLRSGGWNYARLRGDIG